MNNLNLHDIQVVKERMSSKHSNQKSGKKTNFFKTIFSIFGKKKSDAPKEDASKERASKKAAVSKKTISKETTPKFIEERICVFSDSSDDDVKEERSGEGCPNRRKYPNPFHEERYPMGGTYQYNG